MRNLCLLVSAYCTNKHIVSYCGIQYSHNDAIYVHAHMSRRVYQVRRSDLKELSHGFHVLIESIHDVSEAMLIAACYSRSRLKCYG